MNRQTEKTNVYTITGEGMQLVMTDVYVLNQGFAVLTNIDENGDSKHLHTIVAFSSGDAYSDMSDYLETKGYEVSAMTGITKIAR